MARKALKLKRLTFNNPFKPFQRTFKRDAENLPKREAAFTRTRARSLMKKAPRNPKTVHGFFKAYKSKTYERRVAKYRAGEAKRRTGRGFYRKGLYSAPGRPPFWHPESGKFNLKFILFRPIGSGSKAKPANRIPGGKRGGKQTAWVVGPKYKNSFYSTPIPKLHEFGGKVRLGGRKGDTYLDKHGRSSIKLRRENNSKAIYAPRPYMRPAGAEARHSSQRKSPHSVKKLTELGLRSNSKLKIRGRLAYS